MSENFYLALIGLVSGYGHRMITGPVMQKHEILLYAEACRMIQSVSRVQREHWERQAEEAEAGAAEE